MAEVGESKIQKADTYLNWLILEYLKDHDKTLQDSCIIDLMRYSHSRAAKYVSRRDLKRIKKLFVENKGPLHFSSISKKLNLDISVVVEACNKLLESGLIKHGPKESERKVESRP